MEVSYQQTNANNINQNINQQGQFIAIEYFYASTIQRIVADIIDSIIVEIPFIILGLLLLILSGKSLSSFEDDLVTVAFLFFLRFSAFFIYRTITEGLLFSATIGKLLMQIKVVDEKGNNLTLQKAAIRNLVKSLLGTIQLISFLVSLLNLLLIAFTPKKQAVHDIIANTYVVVQINPNQVFQRKFSS